MMRSADNAAAIRPSPGYLYSLSIAAVGLPFTAIALSGALRGRAGGDPMRAMDFDGVIFFLLAFCVGFSIRLLFWPRARTGLRTLVRLLVTSIFTLEILASLLAVLLAWQLPSTTRNIFLPHTFSVLGILCQLATTVWLVRYRSEGL
jgi:hypothetical protein